MGESAVDTGGPAREFWRLLMVGIEQKYCRSGEDGCFFDKNVPALQVCSYLAYFSIIHVHASALVAESEVICDYSYNAITFIFTK